MIHRVNSIHSATYASSASRGAWHADIDEVAKVPVPASTKTWFPVPYATLINVTKEILGNQLPGDYELQDESFVLAQNGGQMFGALTYRSARLEIPFAIAMRGSYNKTLKEAVAFGGRVTCCSNLTLTGLIQVVRKNTKNALASIRDLLAATVKEASTEHLNLIKDITHLYGHKCTDTNAYEVMGRAYGLDIVGAHQLAVVRAEWRDSTFMEFRKKNWWSLYNHFTFAMKTTAPGDMMQKLSELHRLFME